MKKAVEVISRKLDDIITLLILTNRDKIAKVQEELAKDKVAAAILYRADGTLSYSEMVSKVAKEVGVAEITVMKRLSELKNLGVVVGERKGREVFYHVSPLFQGR